MSDGDKGQPGLQMSDLQQANMDSLNSGIPNNTQKNFEYLLA